MLGESNIYKLQGESKYKIFMLGGAIKESCRVRAMQNF